MKFQERFRRFWIGRNGADQLYQFLMWVSLILLVLNALLWNWILYLIWGLLFVYATFRLLSKNVYRRQMENRAFLRLVSGLKGNFTMCRNRFRDRKTHIYKKCPKCKNTLRLPKIKGSHTVCCPCCGNRFGLNV